MASAENIREKFLDMNITISSSVLDKCKYC